jgi:hypothetical protein
MVIMCATCFNVHKLYVFLTNCISSFIRFSLLTAIIYLNRFDHLIFVILSVALSLKQKRIFNCY